MSTRTVFSSLLALNILVVVAAIAIYKATGEDHFDESGFVTFFSFFQLVAIAVITGKIKSQSLLTSSPSLIWKIISLGFVFLAADEVLKIHEHVDKGIHLLFSIEETNITDRIDDVLVGLYGLVAVGVLWFYRSEIMKYPQAFPYFVFAFLLMFTMVAFDLMTSRNDFLPYVFGRELAPSISTFLFLAEDSLKVFAEFLFIMGFYVILEKVKSERAAGAVA